MPDAWQVDQRQLQRRHWPAIERLIADLPPRLAAQGRAVLFDMALRHSTTGRLADIFVGSRTFPALAVPSWLLDDLTDIERAPADDGAERRLFVVSLLLALRAEIGESLDDPSSFSEPTHLALQRYCTERSMRELMKLIPAESPFWAAHDALTLQALEADIDRREARNRSMSIDDPAQWMTSSWSLPARVVACASLHAAERTELVTPIDRMLDDLAHGLQVFADLETMHQDLLHARLTFPILSIATKAGLPLRPFPMPEIVLGAMAAYDVLPAIIDAAMVRVRASRAIADALGLATFRAFIGSVELDPVALRGSSSDARAPATPLIRIAEPTRRKAMEMAESALLEDPTFRESWECHREGMLGADEVVSRFPVGLLLELLSASGIDLAPEVDAFIDLAVANDFRYYDHAWSDADTDTLGVCLRLLPFATDPGRWTSPLDRALGLVEMQTRTAGWVPVWFSDPDLAADDRPPVVSLGEGCGTVAAHLLLGALRHRSEAGGAVVEAGAEPLVTRVAQVGLGANVNYPPEYALATYFRLLTGLEDRLDATNRLGEIEQARDELELELERIVARRWTTAQTAALRVVACAAAERHDRIDDTWISAILRQQRSDGSWMGEPFALAPNRGPRVSWYSSTLLTTALCRDALRIADAGAVPGVSLSARERPGR